MSEPNRSDPGIEEFTSTKAGTQTSPPEARTLPPYKVILHNDDVNDVNYVIRTVMELTHLGKGEAQKRTLEAHLHGLSLLLVTHKERAELYLEQFASKGLTVTIEPA